MTYLAYLLLIGAWIVFAWLMLRRCSRNGYQRGWDAAVCTYDFEPQLRKK